MQVKLTTIYYIETLLKGRFIQDIGLFRVRLTQDLCLFRVRLIQNLCLFRVRLIQDLCLFRVRFKKGFTVLDILTISLFRYEKTI